MNNYPKAGRRFLHYKFITQEGKRATCQITKVSRNTVYYKIMEEDGRSQKWQTPRDRFEERVYQWLS